MSFVQAVEQMEEEIANLKQERDELAAQVAVMSTLIRECTGQSGVDNALHKKMRAALSITPSAALREIDARALEEARDKAKAIDPSIWYSVPHWLDDLAAAKRKGE